MLLIARSVFLSVICLPLLALWPVQAQSTEVSGRWSPTKMPVQSDTTLTQITRVMKKQDIATQQAKTDKVDYLTFKLAGHSSILALHRCEGQRCGTITMTTFYTMKRPVAMAEVNRWNSSSRFARAYVDDDGDPILEADLDMDGGAPMEAVENFFLRQQSLIARFAAYIGLPAKEAEMFAWPLDGNTAGHKVAPVPKTKKGRKTPIATTKPKTPAKPNHVEIPKPVVVEDKKPPDVQSTGDSVVSPEEDQDSGPSLARFLQPGGAIYLTVLKLDQDNARGCPIVLEMANKTEFKLDSLKLAVRIHIIDTSDPWSVDRVFEFPAVYPGSTEVDYRFGGVDCALIERVEVLGVRECLVEGQPFPGILDTVKEGQGGFVPLSLEVK